MLFPGEVESMRNRNRSEGRETTVKRNERRVRKVKELRPKSVKPLREKIVKGGYRGRYQLQLDQAANLVKK